MLLEPLIHFGLLLLFAPILQGVIIRVKSVFAGRRGAPILQPWFDIIRLFRKDAVISRSTSLIFMLGPVVGFVVPLLASLFIPFGALRAPLSFGGDLVLFIYLFGVARFFTAAAALDTGSAFEGMGASREVTFSCLAEPVLFICLLVMARLSGSSTLSDMFGSGLAVIWQHSGVSLVLVVLCLTVVLLLENSRIPFDDPNTHLELTMVHEVMVLDHSGPMLGLIHLGAAMKLMVSGALIVRILLPFNTNHPVSDGLVFLLGMILLSVAVGVVESVMARFRLVRIPQIMVGTMLISIFSLVLVFR